MLVYQVSLAPEEGRVAPADETSVRSGVPQAGEADEMVNPNSDAGIIMDCLADRPERFDELVERYAGYVASFAFSRVGNRADAEEIAQETMVRAYENLARLRAPRRFSAWLLGIAEHVAADCLKRRGRSVSLDAAEGGARGASRLHPEGAAPGPAEAAGRAEEHATLLAKISMLQDRYRTVLVLKHQRGLTCEQIAESLGLSTSTVTSRLSRAYAMLRRELKSLEPGLT